LYRRLRLTVNPKKVIIFPCSKAINFLGYVVFKDHILVRKITVKKLFRKIKNKDAGMRKLAWHAYAKHGNTYLLSKKLRMLSSVLLLVSSVC
jgi:hypothetical protein